MVAMMTLGRRMRQRLPGERLDVSALPLLRALNENGPMRLSALACQLELDASTVSRHAQHLESSGLLDRTDDPDDGRARRITLSALGRDCLEEGIARRREMVAQVLAHWTDEDREHLRVLLTRLHADLTNPHSTEETS